jgi:putative hemin transport protein
MFGEEWLNVLDEEFNMHLFEPLVASVWMARKPTGDGDVTSVELYDGKGENIALFFGKRKPGEAENPAWRELVASLPAA